MTPRATAAASTRALRTGGQAIAGHEDRPYRQRAYRLRRLDEGSLESPVFALPDPEAAGPAGEPR